MERIKKLIKRKSVWVALVVIIVGGGYFGYAKIKSKAVPTKYVVAAVAKGTVIASISGSGQVSASNQLDIKPKVSGVIVYLSAKAGDTVKAGALIAQIDATDAYKAVRDAKVSLETAHLSLEKIQQPPDALSLLQAENSLANAEQAEQTAQDNLKKAYDDAFTAIVNAFVDMPGIISGLQSINYDYTYNPNQGNLFYYTDLVKDYDESALTYKDTVDANYQVARSAYEKNFIDYKAVNYSADNATTEKLLSETYNTAKNIADAVKSADNFLSFVKDKLTLNSRSLPSQLAIHQSSIVNYGSNINSNLSSLLNSINAIKNDKVAIDNSRQSIKERRLSLENLKDGADALDIRSSQITLTQRQDALTDAQQNLADYYIRAPFDSVLASVGVKKGDTVGSGTTVATIITVQKIAEISVNEVDAAKIKVGQKVTLSFDAVSDLSLTGVVAAIDTLGTVSQGVVSYNVKISFDTQDDRIKPGMSVNASIIIDIRQNVVIVPNSAININGSSKFVRVVEGNISADQQNQNQGISLSTAPSQEAVEVGLSDDSNTEITSGLNEGDFIVTRVVTGSASGSNAGTTSGANSRSGAGGLQGFGGGFIVR